MRQSEMSSQVSRKRYLNAKNDKKTNIVIGTLLWRIAGSHNIGHKLSVSGLLIGHEFEQTDIVRPKTRICELLFGEMCNSVVKKIQFNPMSMMVSLLL